MAKLFLVRHAESLLNQVKREFYQTCREQGLNGREVKHYFSVPFEDKDLPITGYGWVQARETGNVLSKENVGLVFVSPFRRTKETLEGILESFDVQPLVFIDDRIREINLCKAGRMTDALIEVMYPGELDKRRADRYGYCPRNGESKAGVYAREKPFVEELVKHASYETVLVVSHGTSIGIMRQLLEGFSNDELLSISKDKLPFNCGVTTYSVENEKARLIEYNRRYYTPNCPLVREEEW